MNNDRFRFRVWDKDHGEYLGQDWGVLAENGKLLDVYLVSSSHPHIQCEWADQDRYTIEQCTGLKDEDGVLIYEGDIIWVDSPYPDGSRREVCWYRGEWNVDGEGLAYLCRNRRVKVIGNIHGVVK